MSLGGAGPEDLAVVIPTRGRFPVLARTLEALGRQSVTGFETVVVVDGTDERPPDLPGCRVLSVPHRGPGAARNAGVAATERPLVLFLGDDMVPEPDLVERHLAAHRRFPDRLDAVLGHVVWHPEAATTRVTRWLARSSHQFDFASIRGEEASFAHFYSCNVSLKRDLFLEVGGFDESFGFDYEDLDCGYRLGQAGMRLHYERRALAKHLHRYDLEALAVRYESKARGERLMQAKHPWFTPYFAPVLEAAERARRVSPAWALLADLLPEQVPLGGLARRRADVFYYQQLAPRFLAVYEGERELEELEAYLGPAFDARLLAGHRAALDEEAAASPDEASFYRTSRMYLYDLTVFAMSGTKRPYLAALRRHVPVGSSVLDYGCGIGSDGLRLAEQGYRVAFADFDNPSTAYLRWRLERRGLVAPVYDLDREVPGGFDAAIAFDVVEHVEDPFGLLSELERRAGVVAVNFLEPEPDDTPLHHRLPVPALLEHAASKDLLHYRRYHGRSHLVIYRTAPGGVRAKRELALGKALAVVEPLREAARRKAAA